MSIRIMTRVWDARGLPSSGVRLVLLKLADCANDAGERAFPSVQTIAEDCELGRATVQRALRWLEAEHWIQCVAKPVHHRPAEWALRIGADGQRTFRVSLPDPRAQEEGPQIETPAEADQGPHPDAGGASSTTSRGLKRAVALYVPRTVKEPSVPVAVEPGAEVAKPHPIKALLTEHERLFRQYVGQVPHYTGKDAKLASELIAQHGYDTVHAMLPALFTSLDPFIRQSGRDMAILSSCWNKLMVQAAPAVQMSESTAKTMAAGARWLAKQKEQA